MRISEVVRAKAPGVRMIHPDELVASAVRTMKTHAVGSLVVSRDREHVDGMVSERDVVSALAEDRGVLDRRVRAIMTTTVAVCAPDDTVTHAMELVTHRRQRHLPVLVEGRVTAVVSVGDLVKARLEELELETRVVRDAYIGRTTR